MMNEPNVTPVADSPAAAPLGLSPEVLDPRAALGRHEIERALAQVATKVEACRQCQELATTRTRTVFGTGNPEARLVFVGEAPGADEDAQGEPFVGAAGKLLTKIIEACGLRRDEVYICNILKCRPPGNRRPLPNEVSSCANYLAAQIRLIRPEFICALGATAAWSLLQTDVPLGQLRGRFHRYGDIPVLCTYHPAYLLRNPPAKVWVWEDMKMLIAEMARAAVGGSDA